jgi:hypothetical protein
MTHHDRRVFQNKNHYTTIALFEKNLFDFKNGHVLKAKRKTASGLTVTSGAQGKQCASTGFVTGEYKDKEWGEASATLNTDGTGSTEFKFTQLAAGFTVETKVERKQASQRPSLAVTGKFAQDFYAGELGLKASDICCGGKNFVLNGSVVFGLDGLSVGAAGNFDVKDFKNTKSWDLGVQYDTADYTAALLAKKEAKNIAASWYHNVDYTHRVGARFSFNDPGADKNWEYGLEIGCEKDFDNDTTAKAKYETVSRKVTIGVEQRLQYPNVKIGVAASFKNCGAAQNCCEADDFAMSLTLGDF